MKESKESGTRRRSSRVLLVDADPETRALLTFGLRADGSLVSCCTLPIDVHECLRIDGGSWPDVVVIVVRQEDPTLRQIAALCASAQIPILVVTAFAATNEPPQWHRSPSVYVGKPLDMEKLQQMVRALAFGELMLEEDSSDRSSSA
jgi:DNA-binding response OmpR family regulator